MATAWIEHDAPRRARVVAGWLAVAATVALLVAIAWGLAQLWREDLPDPLAIHWGASGAPDGTATLDGTITVTTGLGLAGVALLLTVGAPLLARPRLLRGWMTGLAALAALAPVSLLITLLPNLGAPTWQQAAISGWYLLLVVILPAAVAGIAWAVSARPARLVAVAPALPPGAPVSVTRQTFTERQVLPALVLVGVGLLVVFAGLTVVGGAPVLGFGVLLAVPMVWLSVYRYRVSDEGQSIGFGLAGARCPSPPGRPRSWQDG